MAEKKYNSVQELMDDLAEELAVLSDALDGSEAEGQQLQELAELEERIVHSLELGSPESLQYAEDFLSELDDVLEQTVPEGKE